jgi:hypothetical protein
MQAGRVFGQFQRCRSQASFAAGHVANHRASICKPEQPSSLVLLAHKLDPHVTARHAGLRKALLGSAASTSAAAAGAWIGHAVNNEPSYALLLRSALTGHNCWRVLCWPVDNRRVLDLPSLRA